MDWNEIVALVDRLLNTRLFTLSNQQVTLVTLVVFGMIVTISFWLARVFARGIHRALALRGVSDQGLIHNINQLVRYAVVVVGIAIALQNVGIDLGALFAAGAFFAVALGFAMQGLVQNFVSGVLLLAERSIKNGDVLKVEDEVVRVTRMGLRVTVGRTRDEEDLIIPNTTLAQNIVRNYTLRDAEYRLKAKVGVTYGSDLKLTMRVLKEAASTVPFRTTDREPQVLLTEFGDNAVLFEVHIWTQDPWAQRRNTSELNLAVWWALKDAGVVIAFPQLDVHFDPPVVESITRVAS
jgi:small-conductance mechanosensitive channel